MERRQRTRRPYARLGPPDRISSRHPLLCRTKSEKKRSKRTQSSYGPVPASSLTRSTAKGVLKSKAPETGARALGFSKMRRKLKKRSRNAPRSEEHTSELQSRENLVCRLLLEKKKQ